MARILALNSFLRYLRQLYHISKQYPFWNDVDTWPAGAIVWWTGGAYKALFQNINIEPGTDPGTWELTPVRTQRLWRRVRHQRLPPGAHQPNYPYGLHHTTYDALRSAAFGNQRLVFLQLCRAWQNGSGYPYATPALPPISIDYTAWTTIASTYLYQVRPNSYWPRNPFQWFMAYNLAAASANSFSSFWNNPFNAGLAPFDWPGYIVANYPGRLIDNGHPLCFTGAPLPTYDPIQITAAEFNEVGPPLYQRAWVRPTPNLGAQIDSGNPPTTQDLPTLLMSSGPTVPQAGLQTFRTKASASPAQFWDYLSPAPSDWYETFIPLRQSGPPFTRSATIELRYIRNSAPWSLDDPFIPCAEPGPPFRAHARLTVYSV